MNKKDDVLIEVSTELLEHFEKDYPAFKTRNLSEDEKYYFAQIITSDHYKSALVWQRQDHVRMMYMSLPFATMTQEMKAKKVDLDFIAYLSVLSILGKEDIRLKQFEI